ncbi:MAG TPA: PAS domain S-box protein [Methanoregula sp.]|nr:PAS domain S-box protein [Methanoregula sp.]
MDEYQTEINRIKQELERHPDGLSITDIATLLDMNRNSVAKYMDILQVQGSADGKKRGTSKVYYISHRMPEVTIRKICRDAFITLDQNGVVTDYNQQFSTITGLPPEQILGKSFEKLPFGSFEGGTVQQIFRAALKGIEQRGRAQLSIDKKEHPVNLLLLPLVFATGKPGVTVILDNQNEVRGNAALPEQTASLFHTILDNQTEYAVHYSKEGIIRYANETYCRATGRSREDLIGRPFKHLVPTEDAERINENRSRLSLKYPAGVIEFRAIMANGEARWQRWWDHALFDEHEQLTGYFSCGTDITDEVLAKTKLKKSQELLEETIVARTKELREINRQMYEEIAHRENVEQQLLLTQFTMDNAADMVFWVNHNARVDYANKAAITGLGYTNEEISQLTLADLFPVPVTESWSDIWDYLKNEGTITQNSVIIRKDGVRIPIEIVIRYLEYHKNEFACCFCRDISERTRMEHTLYLANKKLNVLTSLTRHDIQNKITVLLGYLGRAQKREKDPVISEYLDRQEQAVKAIREEISITRDFKDLGIDPPDWLNIRIIASEAAKKFSDSPVKLVIDLTDLFVYADRQLGRVFFRLFENAVQSQNPPQNIRVFSREEPERYVIVVEYDGPGISQDDKDRIFDPGCEESGLKGLFIIREILSLTDITLKETGEPGKQTRFEIGIPPISFRPDR